MAEHARLRIDAGVQVYFCDPHSPWQRATNENTNGLLRQYFPKGTDLSAHRAEEIAAVAAALNARPRKTLDWKTPAEALDALLQTANKQPVASAAIWPTVRLHVPFVRTSAAITARTADSTAWPPRRPGAASFHTGSRPRRRAPRSGR